MGGSLIAADKPNIVIILADDLGWGDVGFNGSECMTPNIDAFAEVGVKMNRFYTAPVSTPTRARSEAARGDEPKDLQRSAQGGDKV